MRAITLFALVSVAGAVVRWPANASTFEPSACCTIFGGSFSSSAVAYGLDASETTGELYAQGSRFGIEGSISLNPAAKLAVAFWGGGGDVEASVAGALVYFSHVTGALEEVTWNASACTASPFTSESSPSACVGGHNFPHFFETAKFGGLLGSIYTRWASPCGHAHITVNYMCMPTALSLNITGAPPHSLFPLFPGASGCVGINYINSTAMPWPTSSYVCPARCRSLMHI